MSPDIDDAAGDLPKGGMATIILPVLGLCVTGLFAAGAIAYMLGGNRGWWPWAVLTAVGVNVAVVTWQTLAWAGRSYGDIVGWRLVWSLLPHWLRGAPAPENLDEHLATRPAAVISAPASSRERLTGSGDAKRVRGTPAYLLFFALAVGGGAVLLTLALETSPPRETELLLGIIAFAMALPLLWPLARLPFIGIWREGDVLLMRSTVRTRRVPLADVTAAEPYLMDQQSLRDVGMLFGSRTKEFWFPVLRFRDGRPAHRLTFSFAERALNEKQVAELNRWLGVELVSSREGWDRFLDLGEESP